MPILLTEHLQSNQMLANAKNIDISIYGKKLAFEVFFNEKEDATRVSKWYKPTVKKFFYTLCKRNLDRVWKFMVDCAYEEGNYNVSGMAQLLLDSWDRGKDPSIIKKLRFDNIEVASPEPHCIHARSDMHIFFYSFDSVEIVDFVPSEMSKSMLKESENEIRMMILDASNYGIKNGHIKRFKDLM